MPAKPLPTEVKARIVWLYTDDKLTIELIHQRLGVGRRSIRKALDEANVVVDSHRRQTPFGPGQFP
jgi:transposase-like protein